MRLVDLGKHRRARLWFGDLPDAAYQSVNAVKCSISASRNTQDGLRLAAIEVLVPLGGRSIYGLLGGEFRPDSSNRLDVDVFVASAAGPPFASNLATQTDKVRVGLPAEYVEGVLGGVALAKGELDRLAAGKLLINCAAHGEIGSCEVVFKHLALALVKLFNREGQALSDGELISLFPSTFS